MAFFPRRRELRDSLLYAENGFLHVEISPEIAGYTLRLDCCTYK
jgi:hypothetical protein